MITFIFCLYCIQYYMHIGRAYRCKLCDFDLCMVCYSKKSKLSLEGQLRGK